MWFLEHESLFAGKRIWLRPGSTQLFGRTKSSETENPGGADSKSYKIDNKAVSRKHVTIAVSPVPLENGSLLHTRSQIEITDLSCRQGVMIDGTIFLKSTSAGGSVEYARTTLKGTEHTIRLAQGYAPFRIVWRPVVFTYASRESKDARARSAKLHQLDIKTTAEFQFDKTTHVISQKRNLPKVLSGLVAGKHIVTGEFLDEVLRVGTPGGEGAEGYVPSKLEEDFAKWWPKEKEYVPPIGAEPVARPAEMLAPDVLRSEIFAGLTFVFLTDTQYGSLVEPVTCGGGKGLLYELRPGETTVQEYVDYVHNVAGEKKRSRAAPGKLPLITIRLGAYPAGMEEWAASFVTGVDQALQQRSVLQNELLDVIVTKDRAALQRPPAEVTNTPPSTALRRADSDLPLRDSSFSQHSWSSQAQQSIAPQKTESSTTIPRKRIHRPKATSRFTGFDDYEAAPPAKRNKFDDLPQTRTMSPSAQQLADEASAAQIQPSPPIARTTRAPTSATSPLHSPIAKTEQIDTLFPAAAALRRQRAATAGLSAPLSPTNTSPNAKVKPKGAAALEKLQRAKQRIDDKDLNIREQTRARVKLEEERRAKEEEGLREALEGLDVAQMRNLAVVEEMEVFERRETGKGKPTRRRGADGMAVEGAKERWDPAWNGRRNFKRFRRRGVEQGLREQRVLVPLQEAEVQRGFGVVDAFLLDDGDASSSVRAKKSRRGRQRAEEDDAVDDEDGAGETGFTRRKNKDQENGGEREVVHIEDSADEEPIEQQRTQRSSASGRTQRVAETQIEEQTQTQNQTQKGVRKRGAGATASGQPPGKRGRADKWDADSDEEETGFRFRRRR